MSINDVKPGTPVVYVPKHGKREDGIVTGISERLNYVFVRFAGQHPTAHGLACRPEDLEPA